MAEALDVTLDEDVLEGLPDEDTPEEVVEEVKQEEVTEGAEEEQPSEEPSDEATEDDEPEALVSNPVRQLRTALKQEKNTRLQLERELKRIKQSAPEPEIQLPPEPDYNDPDINFDPDILKEKQLEWAKLKVKYEQQQEAKKEKAQKQQQAFNARLSEYEKQKQELGFSDFENSENAVLNALDVNKQGIIVHYLDDPAKVVYVLGKSPVTLQKLSEIDDPLLFQKEILKIEQKANQTMSTKKPPAPERVLGGKSKAPVGYQKQLDKLREAGNITEAVKLKRELRAKGIQVS